MYQKAGEGNISSKILGPGTAKAINIRKILILI
jgi:hypothetical protein